METASEFFRKFKHTHSPDNYHEALIEFAKMHRVAILNKIYGDIDKEFESECLRMIEGIYPESNIK